MAEAPQLVELPVLSGCTGSTSLVKLTASLFLVLVLAEMAADLRL